MLNGRPCRYASIVFGLSTLSSKEMDVCQLEYMEPLLQHKQQINCFLRRGELLWQAEVSASAEKIILMLTQKKPFYVLLVKSSLMKILALTHKTPVAYITQSRMVHAAQLLISTDTKIIDVACLAGFYNLSYFNRVFKQYYQCTPWKYRLQYKQPPHP